MLAGEGGELLGVDGGGFEFALGGLRVGFCGGVFAGLEGAEFFEAAGCGV